MLELRELTKCNSEITRDVGGRAPNASNGVRGFSYSGVIKDTNNIINNKLYNKFRF